MTGRDLITASLRLLGVIAPGESIDSQEATDGLATFNRMISSWSIERLIIHSTVREEFTLTPGTQTYTMGTGATLNTTRPVEIERAAIEVNTSSPASEYPLNIRTAQEWASITSKELSSSIPTDLYAEGTYPNETINLYPNPSAAHKLVLYSQKALTSIASLNTSLSVPPGYERAMIYNLAIELSPEYGKAVPDAVALVANESKAAIKRANSKPRFLKADPALLSRGSSYDINTGGYA